MPDDPLLTRLTSVVADVPGVQAVVLGGSRARGRAHAASDYDIGLYFKSALDIGRLLAAAKTIADDPAATTVTPVGEWGPWIVGGAWLSVEGRKVDLLYRDADAIEAVMESCGAGVVTMDYQPGHPHGFCSALWMGEIAYCQPLHDPTGLIARFKSIALPYPEALRSDPALPMGSPVQHRKCRARGRTQRKDPRRGLPLQIARLRRAGSVRTERALSDQREGGAAGGSRPAADDSTPGGAGRRNLATRR
ncbi:MULTISPECIES: nucleotidyltransferase domain-containing protein [unclassified Bradyrhizobium]|uniref:nucleotidyltransferase domain-containing protein n=1 Tax=unclassified Bradyrhizobium TaxID=2631580 RepID=UPI001CD7A2F2|nr:MULTISPECIES: nucleotidyltransferase domain-containing protein [unclassified Bradyrhizobium]MCA1374029.1 nucleotidyltransferase domain-containing protein [Bradyrhizobium sp. IC4060]MCA1487363.1 nucleotidyltransferase domain-containing protein [Bradyrhizobium sp. IC4061]